MLAIRGATTVVRDCAEEIRGAVAELLKEIERENHFDKKDAVCIFWSSTKDITSFYPAKAAREAGYSDCALFSSLEPDIAGALPLCIRVMLLLNGEGTAKHVYLRGAKNLRKDLKKFTIALDGPSGSGKSTIAKLLAGTYNILYLDTGAMYRACALKASRMGLPFEEDAIAPLMREIDLKIEYRDGSQRTILDGKDVSEDIRKPEVSMAASKISALACVRSKMVEMQREIAASQSCVLDGRDIGTHVLPNAEFKFYLTADSKTRAARRGKELAEKGYAVDFKALQKEIEERDRNDSTREFSPLRKAEDAVEIDTSDLSVEEVVAAIKQKIQEKV